VPFVISHPESPLSRDITTLARTIAGDGSSSSKTDKTAKRGLFARR
jgi:MinD-like ATPase involved in chromosome partitioning or flagellar assembly